MSDLAAQAGLLLHNIGLTEQLRARLAELQASRLRIVAAADDQRRRIERDIHDGAQQQLLTIASTLALAESVAGQDEERERALVAQLKAETSGALETLRELARGIYPPLLADQGLAAAISTHAGKAPGPVEVSTDGLGRYPAEIETAVYFCCVEALHNAARHAPGSAVRIILADTGQGPEFEVTDNGPGFDPAAVTASGLRNMSDRLAALGGSCQVDSSPGRGTTVTGRIGLTDQMAGNSARCRSPAAWRRNRACPCRPGCSPVAFAPGDPLPPLQPHPYIDNVTGADVIITGTGPERRVAVLFSHQHFPGVRFGHRFSGRDPGLEGIELKEEIETGALHRMMQPWPRRRRGHHLDHLGRPRPGLAGRRVKETLPTLMPP